ncbi:hypothetical protein [Flavobacterium anhuiense]|uniref:hypothetical protein n=2 Tax=Flavobacteriaceae TaxID=49546 RepID=UPI001184371C|nr:hypothetical protein [Flavobacterium anhuiense]
MTLFFWCLTMSTNAQVGIPSNNPNKDAVLDLNKTDGTNTKGLLLPKVALTAINNIAPMTAHVAGMHVWNTATAGTGINAVTPGEYFNNGTKWIRVSSAMDTWIQDGNNNGAIKAIGTNDAFDFPLETNSTERMRITSNGQLLVNTTTPLTGGTTAKIQINNGTSAGALQIKDGSEGYAKVLTSDANGLATWQSLPGTEGGFVLSTTTIAAGNRTYTSASPSAPKYLGRKIVLTPGRWLVYYGELIQNNAIPVNSSLWIQMSLSESQTAKTNTNFSFVGSSLISGSIDYLDMYSLLSGVAVIEVTNNTTLYSILNAATPMGTATINNMIFNTGFGESYLFATKMY